MPDLPSNLQDVMREIDVDGSGCIDYTEFLAGVMDHKYYEQESTCWEAFHSFDRDGNGTISRAELMLVLQNGDVEALMGSDSVGRVLAECDADGDGQISFDEFMTMMRAG